MFRAVPPMPALESTIMLPITTRVPPTLYKAAPQDEVLESQTEQLLTVTLLPSSIHSAPPIPPCAVELTTELCATCTVPPWMRIAPAYLALEYRTELLMISII
eukprot:1354891-Prymnesium_polylepis.2